MNPLLAFMKKEYCEAARTGKLIILVLLFFLFGIMNPAIAKLTPWMMEMYADSMTETGLIVTNIQVNAMTSWTQFFKNIPIALIAYILIFSDIFTKEYKTQTLLLVLTKGLPKYKVVLAKTVLLFSLWTVGYALCFTITYSYNAYFWDNNIANNLSFSVAIWWLFGIWVTSLIVLFSSLLRNNTGVTLCIGGSLLLAYFCNIIPKVKTYSPLMLTNTTPLLLGTEAPHTYTPPIIIVAVLCIINIIVSIPITNSNHAHKFPL